MSALQALLSLKVLNAQTLSHFSLKTLIFMAKSFCSPIQLIKSWCSLPFHDYKITPQLLQTSRKEQALQ